MRVDSKAPAAGSDLGLTCLPVACRGLAEVSRRGCVNREGGEGSGHSQGSGRAESPQGPEAGHAGQSLKGAACPQVRGSSGVRETSLRALWMETDGGIGQARAGCVQAPGMGLASQAAGTAWAGFSVPGHPEGRHLELSNAQDAVTPWGQARHPWQPPRAPARDGRLHTLVLGWGVPTWR